MEEIKITLETLYDILRNEKKREDLQKLDNSFFVDVVCYLKEKKTYLEVKTDNEDIFSVSEKDKLEYELRSIRRILKEIYEKREKKIIDIALNKSRTGSDIIDTSSMLREEKLFYEKILSTLNNFRLGILNSLFKAELPDISLTESIVIKNNTETNTVNVPQDNKFGKYEGATAVAAEDEDTEDELDNVEETEETEEQEETTDIEMAKIKFLHPVPSFVWKDMKVYGPYDAGEETEIFPEVAELLIRKGRAEKIEV
jgi:hypothetical protein